MKYVKRIKKKGSANKVKKGDFVSCYYTGRLTDGTVFDTNCEKSENTVVNVYVFNVAPACTDTYVNYFLDKKGSYRQQPLRFKAGLGKVIRGVSAFVT